MSPTIRRKQRNYSDSFGSSIAAKHLEDVLNRVNASYNHEIADTFNRTSKFFNDVNFVESSTKEHVLKLIRDAAMERIDGALWPPLVKNLLKNCIHAQYRKANESLQVYRMPAIRRK